MFHAAARSKYRIIWVILICQNLHHMTKSQPITDGWQVHLAGAIARGRFFQRNVKEETARIKITRPFLLVQMDKAKTEGRAQ